MSDSKIPPASLSPAITRVLSAPRLPAQEVAVPAPLADQVHLGGDPETSDAAQEMAQTAALARLARSGGFPRSEAARGDAPDATDAPRGVTTTGSGDLSRLPPLGPNPSPAELKSFVSRTYDLFPPFGQLYEGRLGLQRDEALAFMFADMSRESGADGRWRMDLETGEGPSRSWGPFQAAVTNFKGGGYDASILNQLGLPTPDIQQFKNPAVSTFTGMKRLAEGAARAHEEMGPGHRPTDYLLGSLADHNTGWVSSWKIPEWQKGYGNEVLRLMSGYLDKGHMRDNKAYWTGEPL